MLTYPDVPCLPYPEARPLIKPGDILLCSGSAVFSKLIQYATDSMWSHVAFLWRMADRVIVLESVESIGTRIVPLSHYVGNYNGSGKGYHGTVYVARHMQWGEQTPETLTHFSQTVIDRFGYPYDKGEILDIAMRITAAKLGIPSHDVVKNTVDICSEYVEDRYQFFNILIPFDQRGFIAPKDFADCPEIRILFQIEIQ